MAEKPTPDEYFGLLSLTIRDMMIAGGTRRSDAGDEAIVRFAYLLREALGLPQPGKH